MKRKIFTFLSFLLLLSISFIAFVGITKVNAITPAEDINSLSKRIGGIPLRPDGKVEIFDDPKWTHFYTAISSKPIFTYTKIKTVYGIGTLQPTELNACDENDLNNYCKWYFHNDNGSNVMDISHLVLYEY